MQNKTEVRNATKNYKTKKTKAMCYTDTAQSKDMHLNLMHVEEQT